MNNEHGQLSPVLDEMAATFEREGTFRFFDLPSELRIVVYNFTQATHHIANTHDLETEDTVSSDDGRTDEYLVRMVQPNLPQVCTRVKSEVEPLLKETTTFVFEHCGPMGCEWITPRHFPPMVTTNIHHAVFKIHAWCFFGRDIASNIRCNKTCVALHDIHSNVYYIEDVVWQFPSLRTCEVEVNISCPDHDRGAWTSIMHAGHFVTGVKTLAEIDEVTRVRVWKEYTGEGMLWGCWDEDTGWHSFSQKEDEE